MRLEMTDDHELETDELTVARKFGCALCNHRSHDEAVLHEHINSHKEGASYRCLECDFKTVEPMRLMQHSQAGCDALYECNGCGYKCDDKAEFVDHMELHAPEFDCAHCNYKTKSEPSLILHFSKVHVTPDEIACKFCGFVTSSVQDLIGHLRRHDDVRPFGCSLCEYRTHVKAALIDHLRARHEFELSRCDACYIKCVCSDKRRPHGCGICFLRFTRKSNLNRHLKLHRPADMLRCASCGFGTFVKITLINHLKTHRVNN